MVPDEFHVFAIVVEFSLSLSRKDTEHLVLLLTFILVCLFVWLVVKRGIILSLLQRLLDVCALQYFAEVLPRLQPLHAFPCLLLLFVLPLEFVGPMLLLVLVQAHCFGNVGELLLDFVLNSHLLAAGGPF